MTGTTAPTRRRGLVGESAPRPDGEPKVRGCFAYSSDLVPEGALWGATLRSGQPHAEIRSVDMTRALALAGVRCVLLHDDVPGRKYYGMRVADQPVLAIDRVRYQGEPIAVVAAVDAETARRAVALIDVDYGPLEAVTDPTRALADSSAKVHPGGNLVRHVRIRHGDVYDAFTRADIIVGGDYEVGTQDQAFLGPESGLAVPSGDGGVDLYVASQHIHEDRDQIAASLGLAPESVRVVLGGVGGAFGGREDLSMHIHACLLALHTGRPVTMSYGREESFFGHVHRHPAWVRVEHACRRDGKILGAKVRLLLDGGAYTSTSPVVIANASYFAAGAYAVDNVAIDGYAVFTNNPPNGAMRGFGAVQACYAVESNMDRLARSLAMKPLDLRQKNALRPGGLLPTGQSLHGPVPVVELLKHLEKAPLPAPLDSPADCIALPGGTGNVGRGEGVRRGVGYAVGMKAIGFSGGVDDAATAGVTLSIVAGEVTAEVRTAAAECGQGIFAVLAQIVRTELGIDRVLVAQPDTTMGDAGSSSASRQTWMAGGAVQGACREARRRVVERAAARLGEPGLALAVRDGWVEDEATGEPLAAVADLLQEGGDIEASFEYHHRRTAAIDPDRGQGDAHIAFAFAAHRAVVDVDVDLGLVKVVELLTAQDVGTAINPLAVEGQIEGGTAQGLGLALMEEVQITGGRVRNPSFTDYLIPTSLDMPPVKIKLFEFYQPEAPYGLNGVGEPPTLSSTPAVANAVRAATRLDLPRVPIKPEHIALAAPPHRRPPGAPAAHPPSQEALAQ
jgi:xanthine dehydrogenase D subunit